jgi:hypothetical protein
MLISAYIFIFLADLNLLRDSPFNDLLTLFFKRSYATHRVISKERHTVNVNAILFISSFLILTFALIFPVKQEKNIYSLTFKLFIQHVLIFEIKSFAFFRFSFILDKQ